MASNPFMMQESIRLPAAALGSGEHLEERDLAPGR